MKQTRTSQGVPFTPATARLWAFEQMANTYARKAKGKVGTPRRILGMVSRLVNPG
ncbi:MAG: hypothetical protein OEM39_04705 [Acidimicrobiia bacterium]|nr:hypothetical protein [Acidimicrobiia bacterium]MDH3462358.1 hypothetical protein [Acidimicrobiia bacterium]